MVRLDTSGQFGQRVAGPARKAGSFAPSVGAGRFTPSSRVKVTTGRGGRSPLVVAGTEGPCQDEPVDERPTPPEYTLDVKNNLGPGVRDLYLRDDTFELVVSQDDDLLDGDDFERIYLDIV